MPLIKANTYLDETLLAQISRNNCLSRCSISQEVKPHMSKDDDNHADQLNPNNDAYWESRGYDERPEDWEDEIEED